MTIFEVVLIVFPMKINAEYSGTDAGKIWDIVVGYVNRNRSFKSVTGIEYEAEFVGSCIYFIGGTPGTKRAEKGEYLTRKDFIYAYERIMGLAYIDTSTVKPLIKRQQTPFIGFLLSSGILSREE